MTVIHDMNASGESEQDRLFAGPPPSRELPVDLARLVSFIEPELDLEDVCLESPCGAAQVARAISRRVRHVSAVDADAGPLAAGKFAADRAAVTNVTFTHVRDAVLPFLDRSFTLVISAFGLHRIPEPVTALRELVRVSRPGAGLVVADVVLPERGRGGGSAVGDLGDLDGAERLRDPGHVRLLTVGEITELMAGAGAEVKRSETFEVVRPFEAWLATAATAEDAAERIRAAVTAEVAGGPATGLNPSLVGGTLCVMHRHAHLMAVAP